MSGFTLYEWIAASPGVVFEAISNPQKASEIMPNIESMEQITPGAIAPGTKFHEVRLVNGKEEETELEVVAYHPPDKYGVATEQSGIRVTYTYSLQARDDGTQVELVCQVETDGIKRFLLPVVAGIMKREDGDHLVQLKRVLEE